MSSRETAFSKEGRSERYEHSTAGAVTHFFTKGRAPLVWLNASEIRRLRRGRPAPLRTYSRVSLGTRSIFDARMKSFSESPPIACVQISTSTQFQECTLKSG